MNAPGVVLEIARAQGSHAWMADGRCFIDLMNGFGTVFMGHGHPAIAARAREQLEQVWATGRFASTALARARSAVEAMLPRGFVHAGMYSTGMEVAEFAMRVAGVHTGRSRFLGFARSMHGKSAATASLCWTNAPVGAASLCTSLPFVAEAPEDAIVAAVEAALRTKAYAALFVEPMQASNGCREASEALYASLIALCRDHGTLCVFDEIMTGLWRTGTRFFADRLPAAPDVLLYAKSMANGLPVSAMAAREDIAVSPAMLPGSTFAGNPVAAAAAGATLEAMATAPMAARVEAIEACVRSTFGGRREGLTLRGRGALWALEVGGDAPMEPLLAAIAARGVLVSSYGRYVRLLPAATIDPALLRDACARIAEACDACVR